MRALCNEGDCAEWFQQNVLRIKSLVRDRIPENIDRIKSNNSQD